MVSQVVDFSQNTLNMSIIANVISIKLLLQISSLIRKMSTASTYEIKATEMKYLLKIIFA